MRYDLRMQRTSLQREPLVDDERVPPIAVVKVEQAAGALRAVEPGEDHQRPLAISHVVRPIILRSSQFGGLGGIAGGSVGQHQRLDLARTLRFRIERERHLGSALIEAMQRFTEACAEIGFQRFARRMDRTRIGNQHLFADVGLAGHHQQFAAHQVVELVILDHRLHGFGNIAARGFARTFIEIAGHAADQIAGHQFLHGLVTGEGIVVARRKEDEFLPRNIAIDRHRGGKATVDREHRFVRKTFEGEFGAGAIEDQ